MTLRACAVAVACALAGPQSAPPEQFSGTTPCGPLVRQFLLIPATDACERISWRLHFERGAFQLEATRGMQAVNAPGFAPGSRTVRLEGRHSARGALQSYRHATVHTLSTADGRTLQAARLDGVLLHVVDGGHLLGGDAGWSYTLTRAGGEPGPASRRVESLAAIPAGAGGDFEGRTPCTGISRLLGREPQADCTKLKWGLTLSRDGTFQLEGTLYRAAPRRGTWTVRRDAQTGADVYVLDPGRPGSLALLKAGQDVLFFLDSRGAVLPGNSSHSYTLNRSARAETLR